MSPAIDGPVDAGIGQRLARLGQIGKCVERIVFHTLGYDASRTTYQSADGRPMQLSTGEVIRELL